MAIPDSFDGEWGQEVWKNVSSNAIEDKNTLYARSAHPATTYRSSTTSPAQVVRPTPLVAHHPSLPYTSHHTKVRRWRLSPRSPRLPSSQYSHPSMTSSPRRPSRRLRPPRRRNSCGGITSVCCTKSSMSPMSSSSFSTRAIRLGVAASW